MLTCSEDTWSWAEWVRLAHLPKFHPSCRVDSTSGTALALCEPDPIMHLPPPPNRRRRKRSPVQRGLSRFEAKLIAVGVVALVGAGVSFGFRADREQRSMLSKRDAQRILRAAEGHFEGGGRGCPTLTTLKQDQHLDPVVPSSDAWGQRFRVSCESHSVRVRSAGADHRLGSADDVEAVHKSG